MEAVGTKEKNLKTCEKKKDFMVLNPRTDRKEWELKKKNLQMVALILERHWNKSSSERQEETWIICEKMVLLHKIPSQGFCYQNVQKYDKVQVIFSAAHK